MRLCEVNGKRAIFHTWGAYSEIISPSPMVGGHRGGELNCVIAIVEYDDGRVSQVRATGVIFTDTDKQIERLQWESITEIKINGGDCL